MSTTQEDQETIQEAHEAIYVYITDTEAKHPLHHKTRQIRARAVTKTGTEVAEFFADTKDRIKIQARELASDTKRVFWVDSPEDHPVLQSIVAPRTHSPFTAKKPPSAEDADDAWEQNDLALLRAEHHICDTCSLRSICAIATQAMCNEQLVTIAGCLSYRADKVSRSDDTPSV